MQDVENNMDDMFRKAAENYAPNPGDSSWDVIEPQLIGDPIVSATPAINGKNKKNKGLLLLLLLPLIAGVLNYYLAARIEKNPVGVVRNLSEKDQPQKRNNTVTFDKKIIQPDTKYNAETESKKLDNGQLNSDEVNNYLPVQSIEKNNPDVEDKTPGSNDLISNVVTSSPDVVMKENSNIFQDTNTNSKGSPAAQKITVTLKQKRFYAGIVAGPALNQVKSQGFKKAGFKAGLMAGYKPGKNIAVETGLLYTKKYYFSDGKYFSMEKMAASMPPGMKVMSVEGSSNVFEIPVSIKYDIVHKNKSVVFASAGISSYILTKEHNEYTASDNGVQENLKGIYKNTSAGFASSIDVGAGYEHTLGKQYNIRIQPYLQIPLKGIGIGDMQVMSTGINIALTRSF